MSSGGFFVLPFFFFLSVLLIEPSNLASSNQVQALFIQIVYSDFCKPEEMFQPAEPCGTSTSGDCGPAVGIYLSYPSKKVLAWQA